MRVTQVLSRYRYVQHYLEWSIIESLSPFLRYDITTARMRPTGRRKWHYHHQPIWTEEALALATYKERGVIKSFKHWFLFEGDLVQLLVGPDKGKQGNIMTIIRERNWCFVRGLNLIYLTKSADLPHIYGTCTAMEKPLFCTSEVKLVDPSDGRMTDVEWRFTEDGEKVRVSTRTGRVIPIPDQYKDGIPLEGARKSTYKPGNKDTDEAVVKAITYKPKLGSFQDDIYEKFGIKEDKTYDDGKTFWY